jgi:tRNA dimethylallyltransferase
MDEVAGLEKRYGRSPQSMKAIGIVEVLDYFDGRLDYPGMREKIITNTARLAKRQRTFNRSQFHNVIRAEIDELKRTIENSLESPQYERRELPEYQPLERGQ